MEEGGGEWKTMTIPINQHSTINTLTVTPMAMAVEEQNWWQSSSGWPTPVLAG